MVITIEVALSFVLLASAGLMVGTLSRLLSVDPGVRADNLLTLSVTLPLTKYADRRSQSEYQTRGLDRLRGLLDVRATAAVSMPPLRRETWRMSFETDDLQPQRGQTSFHLVSPGYFETMGIPVLRGRSLIDSDAAGAPPVAVVSRSFERRYWAEGEGGAIGKGLTADRPGSLRTRFQIVGVVGDVRQLGLDDDPRAEWYVPYT